MGESKSSSVGWRRVAGVVASAATLLSMGVLAAPAMADDGDVADGARASVSFVDVNAGTPHAGNIAWLAQSGVSTGWNGPKGKEFRPALSVTRQDMAAFLYRVAGSPAFDAGKAGNPFKDVSKTTPHYKEVLWLASSGISTGWKDGTFRGMESVKRQDMAAFLHRLADLKKANPKLGASVGFKDVNASTPHQADIIWLARTGVTTGWKDGTFRGMTAVIRQDMAAFLQRTHDNVLNAKAGTPTTPSKAIFEKLAGSDYTFEASGEGSQYAKMSLDASGAFEGKTYEADTSHGDSVATAPRITYAFSGRFSFVKANADGTYTLQCDASALRIENSSKLQLAGFQPCGTFTAYPAGTPYEDIDETQALIHGFGNTRDWSLVNDASSFVLYQRYQR